MKEKSFRASDFEFRKADATHVDAVVRMMGDFYEGERIRFDEAGAREALAELLSDDSLGGAWVIFHGEEEAGYFVLTRGYSLEHHGRFYLLDELYVRERYRNAGAGNEAMAFIEGHARSRGIRSVHLETKLHNGFARDFYRRRGYRDHDSVLLSKKIAE